MKKEYYTINKKSKNQRKAFRVKNSKRSWKYIVWALNPYYNENVE